MLLKTLLAELTPHNRELHRPQPGETGGFAPSAPPPGGLSNGAGYDPKSSLASGSGFASTAILEEAVRAVHEAPGGIQPQQVYDLFVNGSPAQTLRLHLAQTHADQTQTTTRQRMITLFDPARVWAGAVVRTLSDATGQPVDRMHVRDQGTFKSLATIERTSLPRNSDEMLRIYHADVPGRSSDIASIPLTLMERSDLGAVVVDHQMHPSSVDEMLRMLQTVTASAEWRCQHLLFLLPTGAHWIVTKIERTVWPRHIQIQTVSESISSASGVWNKLLGHWQHVCLAAAASPVQSQSPSSLSASSHPLSATASLTPHVAASAAPTTAAGHLAQQPRGTNTQPGPLTLISPDNTPPPPVAAANDLPELLRTEALIQDLMQVDGLIYVAIADVRRGHVFAGSGYGPDIDRAVQAGSDILRAHRESLRSLGHWKPNEPVEEILVTAGTRYHILRVLPAHPEYFLLAVLDKLRSNLAITRFRVMETIQALG
ncbi:MAG: hypothetical protein AB3X36_11740 [Leptothrix ochracea]|uniref:hypothetical protein n=1 Tax=Leptothrix ochracea TaxID=735331 RepID=UPI0034E29BD5